jgi:hypothetical protein
MGRIRPLPLWRNNGVADRQMIRLPPLVLWMSHHHTSPHLVSITTYMHIRHPISIECIHVSRMPQRWILHSLLPMPPSNHDGTMVSHIGLAKKPRCEPQSCTHDTQEKHLQGGNDISEATIIRFGSTLEGHI